MRKYLLSLILFMLTFIPGSAQMRDVEEMADAFPDLMMSFIDNPYHHANTLKIHGMIDKFDDDFNDFCELDGTLEPYLETLAKLLEENEEI